jgi:putative exosortase-associated protein (TIGR04073 family)
MKRNTRILVALLMASLLTATPFALADPPESYGATVGRKLSSSLANLITAPLEIPKTFIIANNESNVIWGFAAGIISGGVNMIGRICVGTLDLMTVPIPTKPIAYPVYIWDDFNIETTYGPIFRPEND